VDPYNTLIGKQHKELKGIGSHGYLEKAGILFEEMGLERDLDDLERVKSGIQID
jgi:hypothetical protein